MAKTVALHTLGCKLNFSETSSLSRSLEKEGFAKKGFNEIADVYVINTCSVTENANRECRQLVRQIRRRAPLAAVVITGCYAQLKPKEIAEIEGVNLVLGAAEKFNISHHLKEITFSQPPNVYSCDIAEVFKFEGSHSTNERTRVFLKVQDGCDYSCSFCTIPQARGKSRSETIERVINNVKDLTRDGIKEIVLTGINLGTFGLHPTVNIGERSDGKKENLYSLLQALENETTIPRLRISSVEPNLLSKELVDLIARSKQFMPHFHIPMQSGSNKILSLMKRRYTRDMYLDKVNYIEQVLPYASIGADVIVGFPGETEEDFMETYNFIEDLPLSYLHVFTYSERIGTHAAAMKKVIPVQIRNERNRRLRDLSQRKASDFQHHNLGHTRPVLFERRNKMGNIEGYSDNYIKVTASYKESLVNSIVDWQI